jgi:hypothetical protein
MQLLVFSQKVIEEAELCLKDLQQSKPEAVDYLDECSCAQNAVEHAFTAYTDLLEDLRGASETQLKSYLEVRNAHACDLKRLRQQIDDLLLVKPIPNAA